MTTRLPCNHFMFITVPGQPQAAKEVAIGNTAKGSLWKTGLQNLGHEHHRTKALNKNRDGRIPLNELKKCGDK